MSINSKNKGNTFERKIANMLSKRFEEYLGKSQGFFRNSTSGSYFGASNQKRLETHMEENATFGDIIAPSSFNFAIECKFYKSPPSFTSMVRQEYKLFDTWIAQAQQDATNSGKKMLVIAKFNNVPEFVIVEDKTDAFAFYKGYALVALDVWLKRDDGYFFS
jgi:hypothetical protein